MLECEFSFHQDLDPTGKPSSKAQGGLIKVLIESTAKTSITEWMFSPMALKNGKISFPLRFGKKKELYFEEGICVDYKEVFHHANNLPMLMHFTISANKLKIGEAVFENDWKNLPK